MGDIYAIGWRLASKGDLKWRLETLLKCIPLSPENVKVMMWNAERMLLRAMTHLGAHLEPEYYQTLANKFRDALKAAGMTIEMEETKNFFTILFGLRDDARAMERRGVDPEDRLCTFPVNEVSDDTQAGVCTELLNIFGLWYLPQSNVEPNAQNVSGDSGRFARTLTPCPCPNRINSGCAGTIRFRDVCSPSVSR